MKEYVIDKRFVKLTGRSCFRNFEGEEDKGVRWFSLSGSGFECRFSGRYLSLNLIGDASSEKPDNEENYARYAVYVNGIRTIEGLVDNFCPFKEIVVIDSDDKVDVTVKFIKLSEAAMSSIGVFPIECDGKVRPVPDKPLKLEFIGDSITCGYGVDEYDPELHFKTGTEDFTKTYAYKTAKLLDADVRAFSISGWGIISGYVDSPDMPRLTDHLLPPYYKKVGFCHEKLESVEDVSPQDFDHDFSEYVPDLIVINLGTNDNSWCTGHEDRYDMYVNEYVKFLETVHSCNPTSKILCVMGIMIDDIAPYVEKAAEIFRTSSGFGDVYTFRFTPHDGKLGFAADYHPSPATHEKAAKALAERIRGIIE